MSNNYECSVCIVDYDNEVHKPLVLPCSHSFCKKCLTSLQQKHCPMCRISWEHTDVNRLVFCRQLIRSEEPGTGVTCTTHKIEAIVWCEDCRKPLCKNCVVVDHKSCTYVLIEKKNDESLRLFELTAKETETLLTERINTCINRNNLKVENLQQCIAILKVHESELLRYTETLTTMRTDITQEMENLRTFSQNLLISEDNLPTIEEKIKFVLGMGNREIPAAPVDPIIPGNMIPQPPLSEPEASSTRSVFSVSSGVEFLFARTRALFTP